MRVDDIPDTDEEHVLRRIADAYGEAAESYGKAADACQERAKILARMSKIKVVELQPDEDAPGLYIAFRSTKDRELAMALFEVITEKD